MFVCTRSLHLTSITWSLGAQLDARSPAAQRTRHVTLSTAGARLDVLSAAAAGGARRAHVGRDAAGGMYDPPDQRARVRDPQLDGRIDATHTCDGGRLPPSAPPSLVVVPHLAYLRLWRELRRYGSGTGDRVEGGRFGGGAVAVRSDQDGVQARDWLAGRCGVFGPEDEAATDACLARPWAAQITANGSRAGWETRALPRYYFGRRLLAHHDDRRDRKRAGEQDGEIRRAAFEPRRADATASGRGGCVCKYGHRRRADRGGYGGAQYGGAGGSGAFVRARARRRAVRHHTPRTRVAGGRQSGQLDG
ncbi:hypothetical protein L1887_57731 [Cichorium endivia]|nr:hypothetical protein L1887_57731 [Cichorium endivia]